MKHYSTYQSQFIEMFAFQDLSLTNPSDDFGKKCYDDTSSATKVPAGDYKNNGRYAIYDQSQDCDIAGYTDLVEGVCNNYPAVLFGDHSRVIKYIDQPFYIGADGVKIIRPKGENLLPEFLYYDLLYHNIPNTGYNRHFKYVKMLKLTEASIDRQKEFLKIAHQADKSKFTSLKSQFIEMFKDLPNNGKIEDLVDKSIASVKKSYQREDEIEYIDISSIDNATNTVMETTRYKVSGAPSRAQQCVRNGDILVSTVRPINRNIAVITKDLDNLVASTGFCVLRPKEGYREYLLSIVKSDVYTERMCDKASGGLYPAVNNSDVFSYEIHIPEERVAEKVSSIYKQADKSKYIN